MDDHASFGSFIFTVSEPDHLLRPRQLHDLDTRRHCPRGSLILGLELSNFFDSRILDTLCNHVVHIIFKLALF